jgi:tetratricopeptide (TPR) repeat protein
MMLNNVSELALRLGDYGAAQQAADQALELARELKAERLLPYVLNNRGLLACRSGDLDRARSALAEAIGLLRQTGDRAEIVTSLFGFAELARVLEMPEQMARLLGALHAADAAGALALSPAAQADLHALRTSALALLGAQQFEQYWRAGMLLSFEAALTEALAL